MDVESENLHMKEHERNVSEKELSAVDGGRISFHRLRSHMEHENMPLDSLVEEEIITAEELDWIRHDKNCSPDFIHRLCRDLRCFPEDIVEYLPDDQ